MLPSGRSSISGAEIKVYISAAKGTPIIDKIANKKIFLAYSVFGGVVLLVALFNFLFRGGGPPIPIFILIISMLQMRNSNRK